MRQAMIEIGSGRRRKRKAGGGVKGANAIQEPDLQTRCAEKKSAA
jgi:hypothetical protein